MNETILDLIRHGEPVGGKRYRGSGVDDPLSPLGWHQMREALGGAAPWNQVVSSPLSRCRLFAADIASRNGLPLAVDPCFREIGLGAWEGRSHVEVARSEPDRHAAFYHDPVGSRPPGAEALESFLTRVARAYEGQIQNCPGRHLLLVCHAGVSRAIIGHALGLDIGRWYRLQIDYAGVTRLRHGRFGPVIEFVNRRTLL